MTERILGEEGSRRRWRFRFLVLPILLCTGVALLLASSANAVHEQVLQLDGDVSTHAYTVIGANQIYDWGANALATTSTETDTAHSLFDVTTSGSTQTVSNTANVGGGSAPFAAASFQRDFESGTCDVAGALSSTSTVFCKHDDSTYATGSKDILGIGNGGWQCNHDNNVTDKIDIMNAYTASYFTGPNGTGDHIIYFGLEKNTENGTNDVGIWLLQGNASCSAPSGHINFTGQHKNKDLLVVSEFTNGGGVSSIKAFQWAAAASGPLSGDGGCIDSHLNPDKNTGGCDLKPIFTSDTDCKVTGGGDPLCATTNAKCTDTTLACGKPWNDTLQTPWLTANGTSVGNTVVPPNFYEGGINITDIFGGAGETAPSCFNTIVPDTRSSASATATLFDFVTNKLGECRTTLSTQAGLSTPPKTGEVAPPANIGTGVVQSGTDTATLTVSGTPSFSGTLTWYLCGPFASPALCDAHGVQVSSQTVTANGSYVSGQAYLTSAGRYCWHAHFEPNDASKAAGVGSGDDDGTNECFTVAKVTPSLVTQATCRDDLGNLVAGDCVLGVNTLRDTATLSNTASQPGTTGPGGDTSLYKSIYLTDPTSVVSPADSSITWHLYKPASGGCTTDATGFPTSRTVTGNNTYPTASQTLVQYKPAVSDGVGTYTFVASYPADSANMNAATTTSCPDTSGTENITLIGSAGSSSDQRWLPNDRVALTTSAGTLTGTLTVKLYSGTFTVTSGVCTPDSPGSTLITGQSYTFNPSGDASGSTYNTTNSTFYVGTGPAQIGGVSVTYGSAGAYFWLVHYDDNNLTDPKDHCESSNVTITN